MAGESQGFDAAAFAEAYMELARAVARLAPGERSPFAGAIGDHLGIDPTDLPVVALALDPFEQPNLQRALDALTATDGVELAALIGMRGRGLRYGGISLGVLTQEHTDVEVGPVGYVELPIDVDQTLTCINFGLLLYRVDGTPAVVFVRNGDRQFGGDGLVVEVMAHDFAAASDFLARLRHLMSLHNVFRGKVVALTPTHPMMGGSLAARFIARPALTRDDIVMPDGVLERIERLTVDFSARASALRAGGRHLRRGLLLHGAPGTGKTHTVRYLSSRLADHTVFILSGEGLGAISKTVHLARELQPAIVVLEDVDLVAEERTMPHAGTNPILFELLNQMDGVEEDADIVFLLTTNRPDLLEPALASRPGRVDLAIEVPLPPATERRRLLELYARGLTVAVADWEPIVTRTEGASAAFLRELLRQAALETAGANGDAPRIDTEGLLAVLADMATRQQALTARLLGSASSA